jgi:endonuclease G
MDLETGDAVALHFAGRFLEANFAVSAAVMASRLPQLRTGVVSVSGDVTRPGGGSRIPRAVEQSQTSDESEDDRVSGSGGSATSLTCTIPVTFTIQVGSPTSGHASKVTAATAVPPSQETESEELFDIEAPPESYANREGYLTDFLGADNVVELPKITRAANQIVTFELDGEKQSELKYQHYSVVMNRKRRMCFYSACNLDGKQSKRTIRAGWRFDSRIPQNLQIMKECYGNAPKFSRGHMTRREDPAWGDRNGANLGNEDSMHVTNTVPQMQMFNAGIWLSLEDFALQNAREDDMRISVITGPILQDSDPVRFGVKVPRSFWKVIAFIHDETGELTATGYSISQDDFLREDEFVFGQFETFQRSLKWIEQKAGVAFGSLVDHDPFAQEEEALPAPLTAFDQIRFVQ